MTKQSTMIRYEGLCLRGPWDGKMVARDMPNFKVALYQPLTLPFMTYQDDGAVYTQDHDEFCYYWLKVGGAGIWAPHGWCERNVMVALMQRYVNNPVGDRNERTPSLR